ncbi:MAG: hypothetical protein GY805_17195 [Chloroflexi bacterium]|nr:hypothetical protein [Chloroflexota bacterium]
MKQSPIFVKHYDLMVWLIPRTISFPKSQRGILAKQLQQELFRINKALVDAGTSKQPEIGLLEADRGLICLRMFRALCQTERPNKKSLA